MLDPKCGPVDLTHQDARRPDERDDDLGRRLGHLLMQRGDDGTVPALIKKHCLAFYSAASSY